MNNDELRKQVEEISRRIDEGQTVELHLRGAKNSARLRVDKKGARRSVKKKLSPENAALNVGKSPAENAYSLDLQANEISDAAIAAKIKAASGSAQTAHLAATANGLPRVVLARDDVRGVWILDADCLYTPDRINPAHKITAPKNFETDLSSIPRIFWSIIEPAELSLAAPLFHDLIYRRAGQLPQGELDPFDGFAFERRQVDDLFLELMTKAGIPRWKRTAAYWAVRGFAAFAWRMQP